MLSLDGTGRTDWSDTEKAALNSPFYFIIYPDLLSQCKVTVVYSQVVICSQTDGQKVLTLGYTLIIMCARYFYILKNCIAFLYFFGNETSIPVTLRPLKWY